MALSLISTRNIISENRVQEITAFQPHGEVDAMSSNFKIGSNNYWLINSIEWTNFGQDLESYHSLISGPMTGSPAQTLIHGPMPQDEIITDTTYPGQETKGVKWICNLYHRTYGNSPGILALIHAEYCGDDDQPGTTKGPGHSRIGLAWWPNPIAGEKPRFTYCGHILALNGDPCPMNIHGCAYLIAPVNGVDYLYVYFREHSDENGKWGHIGVARAPLENVLFRARLGRTVDYFPKYYNGSWVGNGMGGPSSPIGFGRVVAHGDAAYCAANGKYYWVGWTPSGWDSSGLSSIIIYESSDLVSWSETLRIGQISNPDRQYQYCSIIGTDGYDNGVVGSVFYIDSIWRNMGVTPNQYMINRFAMLAG